MTLKPSKPKYLLLQSRTGTFMNLYLNFSVSVPRRNENVPVSVRLLERNDNSGSLKWKNDFSNVLSKYQLRGFLSV